MAPIAKYLEAKFEGRFMCRIATDPDPSNERRGVSGYTMALAHEDPLDQVIRLQPDEYVRRNLRRPAQDMGIDVGVTVRTVLFDGKPWHGSPNLLGAAVSLLGTDPPSPGAVFESRNNIVGSDDTLAFAVNPFHLAIENSAPGGGGEPMIRVQAVDRLDPAAPSRPIWRITDPSIYGRRLPTAFAANSFEVQQATGVFDYYAYFRDRRRFLAGEIARLENEGGTDAELAIQETKSRLFQLEFWGERVLNKMGFQVNWEFEVNGPQSVEGDIGGQVATDQPWRVGYWFGGWDGDLLIGYFRGRLLMPFAPAGR
jgi:hypothetical protein